MGFLVMLLLVAVLIGGVAVRSGFRRMRVERLRDRARLRVIEGQLASLRAVLRIQVAKHLARQRMQAAHDDVFRHRTEHEEYRSS